MNSDISHDIQATLAYHEKTITDLSDMVAKQWAEIDRLKLRLKHTQDKLKTVEDIANAATKSEGAMSGAEFAAQEKPPHY